VQRRRANNPDRLIEIRLWRATIMIARLWQGARAIAPFVVEWGLARPVVGFQGFNRFEFSIFHFTKYFTKY
jgi:hypothetical protein